MLMRLRQSLQGPNQLVHLASNDPQALLDLQHRRVIHDVLCGRAPVDILGVLLGCCLDQLPHQRQDRIAHDIRLVGEPLKTG